MEEELVQHLLEDAGIEAVVGARLTWARRDQGSALPAGVLHRVDGVRDYHLSGASGLVASRVQLDAWGSTYAQAKAVARAVEACVSGVRFSRGAIEFQAVLVVDERDDNFDEGGVAFYRTSLDLMVHHASAA